MHRDDVHRLEWENRKRVDEVKELQKVSCCGGLRTAGDGCSSIQRAHALEPCSSQLFSLLHASLQHATHMPDAPAPPVTPLPTGQALSDAQQFLFEERQRLLLLQAENDELKLQEIQDRQRIQQLLAMTQPLEQTVTFKQGGAPSSVTAFPKPQGAAASAGAAAARAGSPSKAASRVGGKPGAAGSAGEHVLRTVFLPTVDSDFLLLKVESLQAQLNEQVGRQQECRPYRRGSSMAVLPRFTCEPSSAPILCDMPMSFVVDVAKPLLLCAGRGCASCRSSCMRSVWRRC